MPPEWKSPAAEKCDGAKVHEPPAGEALIPNITSPRLMIAFVVCGLTKKRASIGEPRSVVLQRVFLFSFGKKLSQICSGAATTRGAQNAFEAITQHSKSADKQDSS